MSNKEIVVITDCVDVAFNEIYKVLNNQIQKYKLHNVLVHPLVPVKNFSIVNASFIIRLMADLYDDNAFFLVILSANKGFSERIFGKTKNGITFVGNNSGYFNWLFDDIGFEYVYKNLETKENDYKSFGGKFVQAPTIVKLISGISKQELGVELPKDSLKNFNIPNGTIVHCDNFGLMKIKGELPKDIIEGDRLSISVNQNKIINATFSKNMKNIEDGEWVLYPGSSLYGLPELGKVRCKNSAETLEISEGDVITWEKI